MRCPTCAPQCFGVAVLVLFALLAFQKSLAAHPRVELVTIGPGDGLFERFGHTGLRIVDNTAGRDRFFNYGVARFEGLGFVLSYFRGEARFWLAEQDWDRVFRHYRSRNRTVEAQELNLSDDEVDQVVAFLENNVRRENRYYIYEHQTDNCATRARDLLDHLLGGPLRARSGASASASPTYRDLTLAAASGQIAASIGMDFIGGPNQDRSLDGWTTLYLPAALQQAVGTAQHRGVPLSSGVQVLYEREGPPAQTGSPYAGRWFVALGALAWALLLGAAKKWPRSRILSAAVAGSLWFTGLLGAVVWTLIALSNVADFVWNENAILFMPLDVVLAVGATARVFRPAKSARRWGVAYATGRLLIVVIYGLIKAAGGFPQDNWVFWWAALVLTAVALTWERALLAPRAPRVTPPLRAP